MNGKTISVILGILILIFAFVLMKSNKATQTIKPSTQVTNSNTQSVTSSQTNGSVSQNTTPTSTESNTSSNFTLEQVATHNTEADCYSAINGKVYDLGSWVNKHPGGDRAILSICGKDGSSAFNGEHGGESKPETILAGFQIGILVK